MIVIIISIQQNLSMARAYFSLHSILFQFIIIIALILPYIVSSSSCSSSSSAPSRPVGQEKVSSDLNSNKNNAKNDNSNRKLQDTNQPTKPKQYRVKPIKKIKHDPSHFTQGLTFRKHDSALVEGTGLVTQSGVYVYPSVEEAYYEPQKPSVLSLVPATHLPPLLKRMITTNHFGEGITIWKDNILYQLTWQNRLIYQYDALTLEPVASEPTLKMPSQIVEGWGITTSPDHQRLIISDGSANLYFVNKDDDPKSKGKHQLVITMTKTVRDCSNGMNIVGGLNELETVPRWITEPSDKPIHVEDGMPSTEEIESKRKREAANKQSSTTTIDAKSSDFIWANVYGTDCIAVIEPLTSQVTSWIIVNELEGMTPDGDKVTNGIAYRESDQSLWITGKNWNYLYKVELEEMKESDKDYEKYISRRCSTIWRGGEGNRPFISYPSKTCPRR